MSKTKEPRCVDCGADDVSLDDEGLCQVCFLVRGLRVIGDQLAQERAREAARQQDTSRRPPTPRLDAGS